MVGFNNLGYDYILIHFIYLNQTSLLTPDVIYQKSNEIITASKNAKFAMMVWDNNQIVPQVDLYKIHHFDNKAKATSLKVLEFNMGMESIQDLPFPPGTELNHDQMDMLGDYNAHDVDATDEFHGLSQSQIRMREGLGEAFGESFINCSDIKIGEKILIHSLTKKGVECYYYDGDKRKRKQTKREQIALADIIFPYVRFECEEFENIRRYLASQIIIETKGVFKDLSANVNGLNYDFGTGGLHASVNEKIIESSDTHQLVDVDVASYYPNLAIKNNLFPAHLGEAFCSAYEGIYHTRKQYPKGSPENEAFKLALNGAYGGSNNEYSPFLDPQYTMSITINGQLLLCMLVEQLVKVPGLIMIQANTDGVTYLCPHEYLEHTRTLQRWWEEMTSLELEETLYNRMFIRDVNSYIAEKSDGKLKRIGAYAHETALENPGTRELPWHKNWSHRVVAKAAEAHLVHGVDIEEFVHNHDNMFDFFLRTKVPRSHRLEYGGEEVQRVSRYYISTQGKSFEKVMPAAGPEGQFKKANGVSVEDYNRIMTEVGGAWDQRIHTKNKSKYEERRTAVEAGWNVTVANDIHHLIDPLSGAMIFPSDLNYNWYIKEAEKLCQLHHL